MSLGLLAPSAHAATPPSDDDAPLPARFDRTTTLHGGPPAESGLARAGTDTFYIYGGPGSVEGKFQTADGTPDLQDWTGVDLTYQPSFWQISTFNAENLGGHGAGNRAFWCGRSATQQPGWATAPGYGNGWNDILIYETDRVADPSVGQTVELDFLFNHDLEYGYDFFRVEVDSQGFAKELLRVDGSNKDANDDFPSPGLRFSDLADPVIEIPPNGYSLDNRLRLSLRVTSDGAWSDEDGLWPTHGGAVQVDDITLTTAEGSFSEDHEGPGPYLFEPYIRPFAGDFASVFARLDDGDLDPCRDNDSPVAGFIDYGQIIPNGPSPDGATSTGGSLSSNWTYGIPGGWVVNYTGGLSFGIEAVNNAIESPPIPWDLPGTEDDGVDVAGAFLRFTSWVHLPLTNGIFYRWDVRSRQPDSDWTNWQDRSFVYYGGGIPAWANLDHEVGDLLLTERSEVQIRLSVIDLADVFGFPGFDATPSPVYDNVAFGKYRIGGPSLSTRSIDLANDAFPRNGSIDVSTPSARDALDVAFDMARDINIDDFILTPGDSLIVDVSAVIPGTQVADVRMKWALRRNPLFEDALRAAPAGPRDVNVDSSDPAIWTGEHVGGIATTSSGAVVQDRYFFDLPDVDFLYPGDQLHYYFEATDDDGRVSRLPAAIDGFGEWDADGLSAYDRAFVVRALPTITDTAGSQPSWLVVNDTGRRGEEEELLNMMGQVGLIEGTGFDTYTVSGATSGVSNGIGAGGGHGATADQLRHYDSILYLAGDLRFYTLSNGVPTSGTNDKGDDLGVLTAWKALPGQRHTVYFGDNLVSGLPPSSVEGAAYVSTVMGVSLQDHDVRDEIDGQTAPLVVGTLPDFSTEFAAYGGCLFLNTFDSLRPAATAVAGHAFAAPDGTPYVGPAASVVYDRVDGAGDRKVDITFPFGLSFLYEDLRAPTGSAISVRADVFQEILAYLGTPAIGGDPVAAPVSRRPSLGVHPNPFNPRTEIRLVVARDGDATVDVHDLRGARVATLHAGRLDAGVHTFVWDGTDHGGTSVASGVYLVRAHTADGALTRKVALVR